MLGEVKSLFIFRIIERLSTINKSKRCKDSVLLKLILELKEKGNFVRQFNTKKGTLRNKNIATKRLFLRIYEMSTCGTSLVPLFLSLSSYFAQRPPFRVFSLSRRVAFIRHTSIFHVPSTSLAPCHLPLRSFVDFFAGSPGYPVLSLFALSHVSHLLLAP